MRMGTVGNYWPPPFVDTPDEKKTLMMSRLKTTLMTIMRSGEVVTLAAAPRSRLGPDEEFPHDGAGV